MNLGKVEECTDKQIGAIIRMRSFLLIDCKIPKTKQEATGLITKLIAQVSAEVKSRKLARWQEQSEDTIFWTNHDCGLNWMDPQY